MEKITESMPHARRVELSEIVGQLPKVQPFDPRSGSPYEPDDLFLCALGFEPRCLVLPQLLAESGYTSKRAVFFEYETNTADNDVNRRKLTKHLNAISEHVQPLPLSDPDYPSELRRLLHSLVKETAPTDPRITFDLSVAANRIVVTTMAILCEADGDLNVLYSEADRYHPTEIEYTTRPSAWQDESMLGLERGVSDVRPSREVPGQHFDPLPDAIILFPTFKPERSQAVIDFVDPSLLGIQSEQIVWLIGFPYLQENQWRTNALRQINGLTTKDVQYEISTLHYQDTLKTLETIYHQLSNRYKLTLSPIGSKMQAVGSSLFSYIHPDARMVFAIPKEYNAAHYSEGCRDTWRIEFGPLSELRALLGSVGKLVIDEQ